MTAAAAALKTNIATVSRRIERAGETLGTPLFHREGGAWSVSTAGRAFISVAEEFESNLRREENNIDKAAGDQVTTIRIAAPPVIISLLLLPALDRLLARDPLLNIVLMNRGQGSGLGEADLVVQTGDRPYAGRLRMHHVGSVGFGAYRFASGTSPDWVALAPEFDRSLPSKLGYQIFGRPPRVRVDHFDHKLAAMKACGFGGILPDIAASAQPGLEPFGNQPRPRLSLDLWYGYHISRVEDAVLQDVTSWLNETMGSESRQPHLMPAARQLGTIETRG